MKAIITFGILFIWFQLRGQQTSMTLEIEEWDLPKWTLQHFKDTNLTHVSAFKFVVNKKGTIEKDSLLLFEHIWNKESNTIHGINFHKAYNTATGMYLVWNKFETYYSSNGLIVKNIVKPTKYEINQQFGRTHYEINSSETVNEYGDSNRLLKRTTYKLTDHYSIWLGTHDTDYYKTIQPVTDEYEYNTLGQKIRWFHTNDSSQYIPPIRPNYCNYCNPRYLNVEWKYDSKGLLIEEQSYTRKGEKHTKLNYYYDDQNRLVKQIDSSGWYFNTIPAFWKSTDTHHYTESEHTIVTTNNTESKFSSSTPISINIFDKNGRILKSCSYHLSDTSCLTMSYEVLGNKVIRTVCLSPHSNIETHFIYEGSSLVEINTIKAGQLVEIIRYHYK